MFVSVFKWVFEWDRSVKWIRSVTWIRLVVWIRSVTWIRSVLHVRSVLHLILCRFCLWIRLLLSVYWGIGEGVFIIRSISNSIIDVVVAMHRVILMILLVILNDLMQRFDLFYLNIFVNLAIHYPLRGLFLRLSVVLLRGILRWILPDV
jgi:hypothetical protein